MAELKKIMECVPNFSEGRDLAKVEKIADAFRGKEGVRLLDYSTDKDHNRCVITVIGEPEPLGEAVIEAIGIAQKLIDMNKHDGQHPRMGAADVVPFIPIKNVTAEDAVALSHVVGKAVGENFGIPVFLYEKSATAPNRQNLADIRRGQFEGLEEKMKDKELWTPDYGPATPHKTFGAVAVGARMPLCAYNVNLDTANLDIATAIAKKVRNIGGGLHYCKAMGVDLKDRKQTQVSMNLTDYTKTSIYSAFEMIRMEARRYGVSVVGSEVVGLIPQQALIDCVEYYLQIEGFAPEQIIENRIME
ncbi:MAG: glutamate formimidoyltransferase [Eubacteriales bacterium]|nr:glutamate formimidoyltransferase [Eubacteriales bacterium]